MLQLPLTLMSNMGDAGPLRPGQVHGYGWSVGPHRGLLVCSAGAQSWPRQQLLGYAGPLRPPVGLLGYAVGSPGHVDAFRQQRGLDHPFMIMENAMTSKMYMANQTEAAMRAEMRWMLVLTMVMTMMWLDDLAAAFSAQHSASLPTHTLRAHSPWGALFEKGGAKRHPSFSIFLPWFAVIGLVGDSE